jgi:hypothetical protein
MKRRQLPYNQNHSPADHCELGRRIAIHEAGHAVAIYFGNKQKQLPQVFFQIIVNDFSCNDDESRPTKIEGGRLIHTLPTSTEKINGDHSYQQSVEADIINLLAGALAEAHYVADRDNELISPQLVTLNALHNYGGSSDLEIVEEYLQCFFTDKEQQENKISELFWAAFNFINNGAHWSAINALADYILKNDNSIIDYKEVSDVLDEHFSMARQYA